MKNLFAVSFFFIIIGCSKNESLTTTFINENDYWACYDELEPGFYGIYFKFNADGKSDKYCRSGETLEVCSGGDVITSNIDWEVSNDSVLKWGAASYDIISCNKSVVVLYTRGEYRRHKFLIKEFPGKLRKSKMYYEEKAK